MTIDIGYLLALEHKNRQDSITETTKAIQKSKLKFDAIAFTGISGALVAPGVGKKLKKPIILVRKNKNHHSFFEVESFQPIDLYNYIIIDDFIATGSTIKKILRKMHKTTEADCVGIFLYSKSKDITDDTTYYYRKRNIPIFQA